MTFGLLRNVPITRCLPLGCTHSRIPGIDYKFGQSHEGIDIMYFQSNLSQNSCDQWWSSLISRLISHLLVQNGPLPIHGSVISAEINNFPLETIEFICSQGGLKELLLKSQDFIVIGNKVYLPQHLTDTDSKGQRAAGSRGTARNTDPTPTKHPEWENQNDYAKLEQQNKVDFCLLPGENP